MKFVMIYIKYPCLGDKTGLPLYEILTARYRVKQSQKTARQITVVYTKNGKISGFKNTDQPKIYVLNLACTILLSTVPA